MRIIVCASDLARYSGHNRYSSKEETRTAFWSRNQKLAQELGVVYEPRYESCTHRACATMSGVDLDAICRQSDLSEGTPAHIVSRALHQKLIAPHTGVCASTEDAVVSVARGVSTMRDVTEGARVGVEEALRQDVPKVRGVLGEDRILDAIQVEGGVSDRNRGVLHASMGTVGGGRHHVTLVGKVDGRTGEGEVVEVKSRKSRLFASVPDYERVQLHAYMFLTSTSTALHRQQYMGQFDETRVAFDADFWNNVSRAVLRFAEDQCCPPPPFLSCCGVRHCVSEHASS